MVTALSWLLVIASAIWVGIDAGKIMPDKETIKSKNISGLQSPGAWIAGCILFWIVFFPWYLSKRQEYKSLSIVDPNKQVNHCMSCSKYYEGVPRFCPNCGSKTQWA